MDASEKKLLVKILGQVLIADGVLADAERSYLDRVMDSLGLSPDERRDALRDISVDSPVEERVAALSAEGRTVLLREVEAAASIDNEHTRAEKHLVEKIRVLIGSP
jgi:uncharacterized tellurite resistance protein B-like protein